MLGIVLIVVLFVSIIAAAGWWLGGIDLNEEFLVGVEFAYSGNAMDVRV